VTEPAVTAVARLADLPDGGLLRVTSGGRAIVLARVGDAVHALRDECSHDAAPLSDGEIENGELVCPWHFSRFCLRTGAALSEPAEAPVPTYRVTVVDGEVLVTTEGEQ
jgi:nitrite reductase/ring-hydroxylating ferredoxin subunit